MNNNHFNLQQDVVHAHLFHGSCDNVCSEPSVSCNPRIRKYCPPLFEFPASSTGWSQAHLLFSWNETDVFGGRPLYICYDPQFCVTSSSDIHFTKLSDPFRNLSCQAKSFSRFLCILSGCWKDVAKFMHARCSSIRDQTLHGCSGRNQFQCGHKCLSKDRLVDYLPDCHDDIDELYNDSCALNQNYRQTCIVSINRDTNVTQCKPLVGTKTMQKWESCEKRRKLPNFPTLCNGYVDHTEEIDGQIETDETNCEQWQCDNQYTRCDGLWNCRNGADESRCSHAVCKGKEGYPCILANTSVLICLPVSSANDGKIDCLGATDERHLCRKSNFGEYRYQCFTNHTDDNQIANE